MSPEEIAKHYIRMDLVERVKLMDILSTLTSNVFQTGEWEYTFIIEENINAGSKQRD